MSWLIQYCQTPGCIVAIRVPSDRPLAYPKCKWCDKGTAYHTMKTWPDGMPNPDAPWPLLSDEERERRVNLPYWKERIKQKQPQYQQWLRA